MRAPPLAATYLNEKARPYVSAVTEPLGCSLLLPCDVHVPGQLEAVFERIRSEWGGLDFLLHAIDFAPAADLHGRVSRTCWRTPPLMRPRGM